MDMHGGLTGRIVLEMISFQGNGIDPSAGYPFDDDLVRNVEHDKLICEDQVLLQLQSLPTRARKSVQEPSFLHAVLLVKSLYNHRDD